MLTDVKIPGNRATEGICFGEKGAEGGRGEDGMVTLILSQCILSE